MNSIDKEVGSNVGQQNNVVYGGASEHGMRPNPFGSMSSIQLPPYVNNGVFYLKVTMLQLSYIKRLYSGHQDEDLDDHIINFLDVCNSFTFNDISQESIQLCLFPFSLSGDSSK